MVLARSFKPLTPRTDQAAQLSRCFPVPDSHTAVSRMPNEFRQMALTRPGGESAEIHYVVSFEGLVYGILEAYGRQDQPSAHWRLHEYDVIPVSSRIGAESRRRVRHHACELLAGQDNYGKRAGERGRETRFYRHRQRSGVLDLALEQHISAL